MSTSTLQYLTRALLPVALGGLLSACSGSDTADAAAADEAQAQTEQLTLPVTQLVTRDTVLYRKYVADIQALRNVELRARVQGFLDRIYVDEGSAVKKGQLLFSINDEPYRTQLAKAKAALASAQAQARVAELEQQQVKLLVEKNIISKTELDVAKAKVNAAHADIEQARSAQADAALNLSYTHVKAPFDGFIDRIPLKAGSLIDNGTLLTTVSDVQAVYAYFTVSEGEYLDYMKHRRRTSGNSPVHLVLADGTPYRHTGKIETVESEFDANTGSIAFRARFENPEGLLKHGATGRVRLASAVSNAVLLPQKAVFELQDKNYVFVVDKDNRLHQTYFEPSSRLSHFYVVKSGLKPGDRVVYEGIQDARDGMQITPRNVGMDSLLAPAPPHAAGGSAATLHAY